MRSIQDLLIGTGSGNRFKVKHFLVHFENERLNESFASSSIESGIIGEFSRTCLNALLGFNYFIKFKIIKIIEWN